MKPVDLLPNYFDPKPKESGSNKIPGGLGQRQPSKTRDGFIARLAGLFRSKPYRTEYERWWRGYES